MHIKIFVPSAHDHTVAITDSAAQAVGMKFNPSGLKEVNTLKAIAAAFVSECERLQATPGFYAGRELAVAITNMETASMWAVKGATKGK